MASQRLPLTVIGGFLGAGKTTLLNHLLNHADGCRLAVLVNDFGALNVDAELVASRGADSIALSNGCVCCSIGDDLSAALIRVLDNEPPFDALLIEASGVSDPWRIAQVGLSDRALSLGGVTVMVDCSSILQQAADPLLRDSVQRQVRAADWLLLNKSDLVDAAQLMAVHAWLDQQARDTPRFETREARLPTILLPVLLGRPIAHTSGVDARRPPEPAGVSCEHGHDHSHADGHHDHHDGPDHSEQFETASWQPQNLVAADRLRSLLRAMPAGVLRLKGLLRTDSHDWAEIQFAGRHGSLRKALSAPANGAAVVAIGLRGKLPKAELDAVFNTPLQPAPEST
ncbi:MAG: CobW family GTP-binding protein [Ideonella sp.]